MSFKADVSSVSPSYVYYKYLGVVYLQMSIHLCDLRAISN